MEKQKSKLLTILIIPLLLIPIIGVGSAHWYDTILKQYKLHVGCLGAKIITYKVLSPCGDELIHKWPSEGQMPTKTLSISTKIYPGWYCWIGFIIQNQGQFPVWIGAPSYNVNDPDGVWPWFTHNEYFYGQRIDDTSTGWEREELPQDYYAMVKLKPKPGTDQIAPPPSGDIPPPVYLEPDAIPKTNDSMVMWIFLQLSEDCPIEDFSMQLSLTITATMPPGP